MTAGQEDRYPAAAQKNCNLCLALQGMLSWPHIYPAAAQDRQKVQCHCHTSIQLQLRADRQKEPTVGSAALLQGARRLSQRGTGLRSPGNDRRPGIAQAGEAMQLVDFCGSGIHGAQVHGVAHGRVPRDVAAAGGRMITVQGLHTNTHTHSIGMISCTAIRS